jgi:coenzyme F420-reducing hydrogenase delta subunit
MSTNGTTKPLVLAICCSECGNAAVDSAGLASVPYSANVRVVRVPCTGFLRVEHLLAAIKAGAQGVMVVGCKSDGCHHEEGVNKAERRVELAKVLLKEYGIEPERLELFNMVFVEGDKFAKAARMMTERLINLGSLQLAKSF